MYFSTMHPLWSTSANLLCYWTSTSTNPCCPLAPGWTPCLPFSLDCRWVIRNLSCFHSGRENPKRKSSAAFCSFAGVKGGYPASHRDTWNALSGYQETQLPPWGRSSFFSVCLFNFFNVCGLQTLLDFGPPPHVLSHQAFTTDFRVHWAQHPLRPEFAESTYFLYKVQRCHWVIN